jgi:sirohydrochlorin ferrochelatase
MRLHMPPWARRLFLAPLLGCLLWFDSTAGAEPLAPKIGVLLVNHGSRSATWRAALLQVDRNVRDPLLRSDLVQGVKTASMEYTEPSIATRMKEFDDERFTDVIVVPVFLTVSTHTFDDIPTILGRKADPHSLQTLKIEGIARYTPRARTHIGPRLDFTALVRENVLGRARKLCRDPANEGLVLIAYGDAAYDQQWSELMRDTAAYVMAKTGMGAFSYGWAGHIVHYDPVYTTRAVEEVLRRKERAVVVPVFVAFDEAFQIGIIGKGIDAVSNHQQRVAYTPDAILPDGRVDAWVVQTACDLAARIRTESVSGSR